MVRVKRAPKISKFLAAFGPGIIAGAADDDPSGIATYSIAGAQLGTMLLWTAWITWPLMASVQMMCARIGMVTGQGLVATMKLKVPRPILVFLCLGLLAANTFNIAADLSAMADAAALLTGWRPHGFLILFAGVISWATVKLPYGTISRVLKWLVFVLFSYVIVAFLIGPNWSVVFHDTFFPPFPRGKEAWATLVAILGTTISPYLFFWQAAQEVEEEKGRGRNTLKKRMGATSAEILWRKVDVGVGTLFSNLVMFFIILSTALTLHNHGITHLETTAQVAQALRPLAGNFAMLLYTLGLLSVGFLAIPTLTGSAAYALSEAFSWRQGLNLKLKKAPAFYGVILLSTLAAVLLDFLNINPVKALFWSAVVNGLLAPVILVVILLVASDPVLMNGQPSSIMGRVGVGITTLLMFGAAIGMFFL